MAIKAQALSDFLVECTIDNQEIVGGGGGRETWRLINLKRQKQALKSIGTSILMGHQKKIKWSWFGFEKSLRFYYKIRDQIGFSNHK